MKEKALKKEEELLECEKLWIFAVMIAVGGFFGAYTYVQKGGVFCNAQTANFVLMAVQLPRKLAQGAVLSSARFGLSARHGHFGISAQAYKPP